MTGRSEKLAQKGLCGDHDRLAVGKRVGCRVRQIANDLKGVRGSSSLLLIGRYGKNTAAMQYQTDRYVRMSEWHTISQTRERLSPLSFSVKQTRARRKKAMVNPKFGKHDVWISSTCLHVEKEGMTMKVKKANKIIGTLTVTDTHVVWMPKGKSVHGFEMKWAEFANFMVKNGKEV